MLGAIIGDIVGSRFEFNNYRKMDFELFTEDCFFTDDTVMSLAIAEALMAVQDVASNQEEFDQELRQLSIEFMQNYGLAYPDAGYGLNFSRWLASSDPKPYGSWGNGAAMRIAPVGWYAKTEAEVERLAQIVTEVTHNHEEGIKGAIAVGRAIFLARKGYPKSEIAMVMADYYDLDFTIDEIRPTYQFNESCQETVPQAIVAFLESSSFEDAIRRAISVGGDSDTLAAITGSIAEAYYGIPDDLRVITFGYLDARLRDALGRWEAFLQGELMINPLQVLTKYRIGLKDDNQVPEEVMQEFIQEYWEYEAVRKTPYTDRAEYLAQSGIWMDSNQLDQLVPEHLTKDQILALIGTSLDYQLLTPKRLSRWLDWLYQMSPDWTNQVEAINFRVGGQLEFDTFDIELGDSAKFNHKPWTGPKSERLMSLQEINQFESMIKRLDLSSWRSRYEGDDDQAMKWQITIYPKGKLPIVWEGDHQVPPGWKQWMSLFPRNQ